MAIGNLNIAGGLEVYPISSIYMSFNSTEPSILFGGTQERIKDRFILAAGDSYTAGATGGEATHKLTENELPKLHGEISSHTSERAERASQRYNAMGVFENSTYWDGFIMSPVATNTNAHSIKSIMFDAGGDAAHNNMPPYLVAYMWYRTA